MTKRNKPLMVIFISMLIFSMLFLISCSANQEKLRNINYKDVSKIIIQNGTTGKIYEVTDVNQMKTIIKDINSFHYDYKETRSNTTPAPGWYLGDSEGNELFGFLPAPDGMTTKEYNYFSSGKIKVTPEYFENIIKDLE